MLTGNGRSNRFANWIMALALTGVLLVAAVSPSEAASNTFSAMGALPITPVLAGDLLDGITFGGTLTDADVTYLRESLQLLDSKMPTWSQYVQAAKPLAFLIDLDEGAHGRVATAKCCTEGNRGIITFGHHLGTLEDSSDPASHSPEARRITFLATLAHEVTHVLDQRAGMAPKTNRKTCITVEKSGLDKQLEFQQDALTVNLGTDAASTKIYQTRLGQNVQAEASALKSRSLWDQYCGAFEN